jgi:intracellular sulfur oxidation DsrE/DsrF family protein
VADKNVVEIVLQAVDKASKPIQNLRKSLDKTFAPVRQLSNSFQALEKASGLNQVAKSFGEVESKVGNLKNLIVGTATTVATSVAVIGGAFAFLAKGTIESADNMLSLSKQTGVTVEGLQKLRFIASQTGSSTEDLDNGLKKFTVNMGLARAGQGALFQILARVNPEILRQMLATKSNEQAFMLMLQTIQKLPKAQQQAALSQIAFGRGNISLVATAKAGNEEWEKLGKRMEEIGLITQAQAEEANATADAWGEFFLAIQRARDAVMIQALPALKELAKNFHAIFNR